MKISILAHIFMISAFLSRLFSGDIQLDLFATDGPGGAWQSGPMEIMATLRNPTLDTIRIPVEFANNLGVSFVVSGIRGKPIAANEGNQRLRAASDKFVTLTPGSSIAVPFYLTQYFEFLEVGAAIVSWSCDFPILEPEPARRYQRSGIIKIAVKKDDERELAAECERMLSLISATKSESARNNLGNRLLSMNSLATLPYLTRLTLSNDFKIEAVKKICDLWITIPAARRALDDIIETDRDSFVIDMIIRSYKKNRIALSERQIARMISSDNRAIRYLGILYIRQMIGEFNLGEVALSAAGEDGAHSVEAMAIFIEIGRIIEGSKVIKEKISEDGKKTKNPF